MLDQKQYKRISNSLDRQIIGENSNGINISKDGNTFLFSGNNEEYLQSLRSGSISSDKGEIATNDPNNISSFIGMYKQGGANINLGNPNQQSLNINNQPFKNENIITPSIIPSSTSLPSIEPTFTPTPTPTITPTPAPADPIEEGIQDFEFTELPEEEGFQFFEEQEIMELEENNPNMYQPSPILSTNISSSPRIISSSPSVPIIISSSPSVKIFTTWGSKIGSQPYPKNLYPKGIINGELPINILSSIGKFTGDNTASKRYNNNFLLHPEAAKQYLALKEHAKKHKIFLQLNSAYRDQTHQRSLDASVASKAGSSPHGWAVAIDLGVLTGQVKALHPKNKLTDDPGINKKVRETSELYKWLENNAPKFGWFNPWRLRDGNGQDEVWHWEYWGFYI